jgi:SAM-dependent methyltransferase
MHQLEDPIRFISRLTQRLRNSVLGGIPASHIPVPRPAVSRVSAPLSEVMNPLRYHDPEWFALHAELEGYSIDKHVFATPDGHIYRKGWEWTHCLYGLQKLGAITPRARALGVGAGHEPVIFWLGERVDEVIATDLYGNEAWTKSRGREASAAILDGAAAFCARQVDLSRVKFQIADGTALSYENDTFDFCWSLSSIEHFGGHEAAAAAVREMARVTRRGGIVCIATEYLLLDEQTHPEFFTQDEMRHFIIGASDELRLVDGISWNLPPPEYLIDQICVVGEGVHRRRRHVVLNDGNVQWTSVMVFLRKL